MRGTTSAGEYEAALRSLEEIRSHVVNVAYSMPAVGLTTLLAEVSRPPAIDRGTQVIILGELQRGKSRLINELLHRGPIRTESTRDFETIRSDNKELQHLGVTLVDTPPIGLMLEEPSLAGRLRSMLLESDVAILVVSASSPFSLDERSFYEDWLADGRVPFVAIVVSRLDLLEAQERASVIAYVRRRIPDSRERPWFFPTSEQTRKPADLEPFLASAHVDSTLAMRRLQQQAWRLEEIVRDLISRALVGREPIAAGEPIERTASELADSVAWGELIGEMRARKAGTADALATSVGTSGATLKTSLVAEASKTEDPRNWWRYEFPNHLDQGIRQLVTAQQELLQQRLAADFSWLRQAVGERFEVELAIPSLPDGSIVTEAEVSALDFGDLENRRLAFQIAGLAVQLLMWLVQVHFGNSVPMPAALAGNAVTSAGEVVVRKGLDRQRQIASSEAVRFIDRALGSVQRRFKDRLGDVYQGSVNELRRQQSSRQRDTTAAAVASVRAADTAKNRLSELRQLEDDLERWLNDSAGAIRGGDDRAL